MIIVVKLNEIIEEEHNMFFGSTIVNKFFIHIKGDYYQPLHSYLKSLNKYPLINPVHTLFKSYLDNNYESTISDIISNHTETEKPLLDIHKYLLTGEESKTIETFYEVDKFSTYELRRIIMSWYLNTHSKRRKVLLDGKEIVIDANPQVNTSSLLETYTTVNPGSLIYTLILSTQPDGSTQLATITHKLLEVLPNTQEPLDNVIDYSEITLNDLSNLQEEVDYENLTALKNEVKNNQLISAGVSIDYDSNELNTLIFKPLKETQIKTIYRLNNRGDPIPGEYYLVKIPKHQVLDIIESSPPVLRLKNSVEILIPIKGTSKIPEWLTS